MAYLNFDLELQNFPKHFLYIVICLDDVNSSAEPEPETSLESILEASLSF